jgi:hypothetical protein
MKKVMLILCCLLSVYLNAQNSNSGKNRIGITFTPFGNSDVISFVSSDSEHKNDYLYGFGINYIHSLNSWLEMETGIEYSKYHIKLFIYPNVICHLTDSTASRKLLEKRTKKMEMQRKVVPLRFI